MNEKKTLLVDKSRMPLAMGIAFVAFTTQFGGGFASGAQIYQYFINYGIWCLILPALTQGLYALFFWYGMRYAYKHKTYDYRSFSNSLYGRTRPVMSNLYEICYLIMILTLKQSIGISQVQKIIPWELADGPFRRSPVCRTGCARSSSARLSLSSRCTAPRWSANAHPRSACSF